MKLMQSPLCGRRLERSQIIRLFHQQNSPRYNGLTTVSDSRSAFRLYRGCHNTGGGDLLMEERLQEQSTSTNNLFNNSRVDWGGAEEETHT